MHDDDQGSSERGRPRTWRRSGSPTKCSQPRLGRVGISRCAGRAAGHAERLPHARGLCCSRRCHRLQLKCGGDTPAFQRQSPRSTGHGCRCRANPLAVFTGVPVGVGTGLFAESWSPMRLRASHQPLTQGSTAWATSDHSLSCHSCQIVEEPILPSPQQTNTVTGAGYTKRQVTGPPEVSTSDVADVLQENGAGPQTSWMTSVPTITLPSGTWSSLVDNGTISSYSFRHA